MKRFTQRLFVALGIPALAFAVASCTTGSSEAETEGSDTINVELTEPLETETDAYRDEVPTEDTIRMDAGDDMAEETMDSGSGTEGDNTYLDDKGRTIYTYVSTMPAFPGGQNELYDYLRKNLKYPAIAKDNGVEGESAVQFVVMKDGSIGDVKIARSSGNDALDNEAKRVVSSMPGWTPGRQSGENVNVQFTLPVKFKLSWVGFFLPNYLLP